MGKYAILSDIHGNLHALRAVYMDMQSYDIQGVLLLGDLIDYGMQSNEVAEFVEMWFQGCILCNIWGNHEHAIMHDVYEHFSSERGRASARWTASILNESTKEYLDQKLKHEGMIEFWLDGLNCLAIHGALEDYYWKAIEPEDVRGDYRKYDMVFSGHSHFSHVFSKLYDTDNLVMRNKHLVQFINPGSVGQPRNHHPQAQYAVFDSKTRSVDMRAVDYDVENAMKLYGGEMDLFYRDRLKYGI